jgi:hypothetical protein
MIITGFIFTNGALLGEKLPKIENILKKILMDVFETL